MTTIDKDILVPLGKAHRKIYLKKSMVQRWQRYWQRTMCGMVAIAMTLSGCTTRLNDVAVAQNARPSQSTTRPVVTFDGTPPPWADTATEIMAQLEAWRDLSFTSDLQVTFETQADPTLNGWYNSETKQLSVTTDASETLGQGVLLHEIFHALQDQNFDLYNLRVQSMEEPDYNQAVSAIIEGEAMLAVSELMNYRFLDHARLPAAGEVNEALFESIFLYGTGQQFVQAIREQGGWAAVDAMFQDPPQSTALIFSPDRYIAGERTARSVDVPLSAGESLQAEAVRGAYAVHWLFARFPESRMQLSQLADSYVADTLGIVSTEGEEILHRWAVEFESPEAATALRVSFEDALRADADTALATVSVDESTLIAQW